MAVIVGRHQEGIMLNDLEYLLDDNGEVREFKDEPEAVAFLKSKGFTEDQIYYLVFKETEGVK